MLQEGDEISMTDMAQLIAVDSEEDDEDEEDDPDYEPLSMEEDSIQAQEMVSRLFFDPRGMQPGLCA